MAIQRTGSHVFRNGLIFGAVLGLFGVGNTLIQWITGSYQLAGRSTENFSSVSLNNTGGSSILGCLVFLAMLALTFIAGALTARGTGQVGSGTLAGLLAGVFGGLIGGIASVLVMAFLIAPGLEIPAGASWTPPQARGFAIVITAGVSFLVLLAEMGFGAGMGALGGLVGSSGKRKPLPLPPTLSTSGYPGMPMQPGPAPQAGPYPTNPAYPAYPGSPLYQPQPDNPASPPQPGASPYPPQPGNPPYPPQ